jgi:Co/Zn/Cd efflux system component
VSTYQSSDAHRWSTADTVAGFLATLSIFASAVGLIWRPARLVPFAVVLALAAARMSERNQRIAFYAVIAAVVCWTAGMTIAVVTENPLY